jgi:hypothetical protein
MDRISIAMKATRFEYRHQTLLHILLVGLALLSYLVQPDDIVWALVRYHSNSALLERIVFGIGAIMILSSAALDTWANAYPPAAHYPLRLARLLLASALGLLLPLSGALTLVAGEVILVFRLFLRDRESAAAQHLEPSVRPDFPVRRVSGAWEAAFRTAASKWGLAASMIAFTVTLQDRIAEIGAALSFLVWLALKRGSQKHAG